MVSQTNNQGENRDFRRKDSRGRRDKREESPYTEKVVSIRRIYAVWFFDINWKIFLS